MKKPVGFRTSGNHTFIYSPVRNNVFLCHPVLYHLFELEESGTNLHDYIESCRGSSEIHLPDGNHFPFNEIEYQWNKYRFLKRNRFFNLPRPVSLEDRLLPQRIVSNLPKIKQVIFETTEDCNLSCSYCTYSKFYRNKERGKRKLSPDGAKKTLERLLSVRDKDAGPLYVSFYGGEPLKNFGFIRDIVAFLTENYGDKHVFNFNMTTNGLLLTKHAGFLAANDFDVSVSLDGDETGNSFRVMANNRPTHALVIKNLDHLREKHPDYFEKRISFITVLHSRNTFSEVNAYFRDKYGKIPLVANISTTNIREESRKEFSETFLEGTRVIANDREILEQLFTRHPNVKELANTIEKYTGIVFRNHFRVNSGVNGDGSKHFLPTATCLPFSLRVFLAADGTLLPCEHISREFEIGRLENNGIQIDPDAIAALFNRSFDKIRSLCNSCFLADNCKECVFNTTLGSDQPECDCFLDEAKFKDLLAKSFSLIEYDFPLYARLLKEAYHEK